MMLKMLCKIIGMFEWVYVSYVKLQILKSLNKSYMFFLFYFIFFQYIYTG